MIFRTLHSLAPVMIATLFLAGAGCSRESRVARHIERAKEFEAQNKLDEAVIEYRNAVRLGMTNAEIFERIGSLAFDKGEVAQAYQYLTEAKKLEPTNTKARIKLGMILLGAGKAEEARTEAEAVLSEDPANERAIMLLADASRTEAEMESAKSFLEKGRAQSSDTAAFDAALGSLYLRGKDLAAAEEAFERARSANPKSSEIWFTLGQFYLGQGKSGPADQAFQKAVEFADRKADAQTRYANFKIAEGEMDEAKKLLNAVLKDAPNHSGALLARARIAFTEKDFETCAKFVGEILAREANHLGALLLKGQLHVAQKEGDQALDALNRLNQLYPGVPQARYHTALAHLQRRDLSEATAELSRALTLDPAFEDAGLLLAEVNMRRGDNSGAIAVLTELIQHRPESLKAHLFLAAAYRQRGTPNDAIALYRQLEQRFPSNAEIPFLLGQGLRSQGSNQEARAALDRAARLAPDNIATLNELVALDMSEGNASGALARVEAYRKAHPESEAAARWLAAKIYLGQQDDAKAEAALLDVLEAKPDFREAHFALANLRLRAGEPEQAIQRLRESLARNPEDIGSLMVIGMIQEMRGEHEQAAATYRDVLQKDADFWPALNNLACLYGEHLGQLDRAHELAAKARRIKPDDPSTADTLGWILYKKGDYNAAFPLLQESVERLSDQPEVLYHFGMVNYMRGQRDEAREVFERLTSLPSDSPFKELARERLAALTSGPTAAGAGTARLSALRERAAKSPNDAIAAQELAEALLDSGAQGEGRAVLEKAVAQHPNAVPLLTRLAELKANDDPAEAMALLQRARKIASTDSRSIYRLGKVAEKAGDFRQARTLLLESASALPSESLIRFHLGRVNFALGELEQAETALKEFLRRGSQLPEAKEAKALLEAVEFYREGGAESPAGSGLDESLAQLESGLPAQAVRAKLMERQGRFQDAAAAYESILERFPTFIPAARDAAVLYGERLDKDDRCLELGLRVRGSVRGDPVFAKTVGRSAYREGDYRAARQWLEEAAQSNANDGEASFFLGMTYYRLNRTSEGKLALNKALEAGVSPRLASEARKVLENR